MSNVPETKSYAAYVVLMLGTVLAIPLWREFHEPGQEVWNIFLAAFLIGLVSAAFLGIRYLQKNKIEVGEARFKTTGSEEQ